MIARLPALLRLALPLAALALAVQQPACQAHQATLADQQAVNATAAIKSTSKHAAESQTASSEPAANQQLTLLEQATHRRKLAKAQQVLASNQPALSEDASLSSSMLKTFIRINDMRAYHLDLHSYRPEARYSGDPDFVDSRKAQHLTRCAAHLDQYQLLLKSFTELDPVHDKADPSLLRLVDSFGRPEAGILSGNQFWLGSYSGCLNYKLSPSNNDQPIRGQYCLGITQYPNWNPLDSKTAVKVGLCLPETCTSSMLNDNPDLLHQVETMMKYQFGASKAFDRLKLREVYCLPHETSQVRRYSTSALVFFVFTGTFVALSMLATLIDYLTAKLPADRSAQLTNNTRPTRGKRQIIIEAFSLSRNLHKLLSIRTVPMKQQSHGQVNDNSSHSDEHNLSSASSDDGETVPRAFDKQTFLNSTTGLKCIGLFWIICAHTFLVAPITSNNLIDSDELTKTYLADIFLTAHLVVDTFFALSGVLAAYLIFSEDISRIETKHWLVLTVHRYWRLTPIYLINYWFTKSVGSAINTGPMWDYGTAEASPRLNCARESWLEAIFHMSDFKSPKEHCVPFAWFIANGIKFWLVTPIFLILIHKSLRRGYTVIIGTILANIVLVTTLALQSKVDIKSVIEFKPESANNMLNNMGEVYTRPYSRIGTYLIGLLAGHLMYLVDTNKLEVKLSKNANIIIWTIFSVTVIVLTFMLKIARGMELEEAAIPWVFALSSAIVRPLWALCTCWFVFAMSIGQIKWMTRFLSANIWRVLVRLSFCAYLVQGEVIAQLFLSTHSATPFTYKDMISLSIVTIVLTLFFSSLVVLFVEYPLIGIEQLLLPRKQVRSSTENSMKVSEEIGDGIVEGSAKNEKLSTKPFLLSKDDCSKLKSS